MKTTSWWVSLVSGLALATVGGLGYAQWRLLRLPRSHTAAVAAQFASNGRPAEGTVVALIGDSLTHGHFGSDYVQMLRERADRSTTLINGGVNGELLWNMLQRLPEILELRPDLAVVFGGCNDVMGAHNERDASVYAMQQWLPEPPSREFFQRSLRQMLSALHRAEKPERVAVCTLPPFGGPWDSEINRLVEQVNHDIRAIAAESGTTVLHLDQRVKAAATATRRVDKDAYVGGTVGRVVSMMTAGWWHYLVGLSWDEVGARRGLVMHTDWVHANDRSGAVTADVILDLIEDFQQQAIRHKD